MRTSITIRPAGMASAVTALAVATMLAACVASTGGPVPGPREAAGLVQFRAAERAVVAAPAPSEAQSLAAFRAGERVAASGATSEAQSLVQFRAAERATPAGAASPAGGAQGRYVR